MRKFFGTIALAVLATFALIPAAFAQSGEPKTQSPRQSPNTEALKKFQEAVTTGVNAIPWPTVGSYGWHYRIDGDGTLRVYGQRSLKDGGITYPLLYKTFLSGLTNENYRAEADALVAKLSAFQKESAEAASRGELLPEKSFIVLTEGEKKAREMLQVSLNQRAAVALEKLKVLDTRVVGTSSAGRVLNEERVAVFYVARADAQGNLVYLVSHRMPLSALVSVLELDEDARRAEFAKIADVVFQKAEEFVKNYKPTP